MAISKATLDAFRPLIKSEVRSEVLVVGGGTAGFIAAVAAARTGASTILVEYLPFLGGTHGGGAMVMGTIGFTALGTGSMRIEQSDELLVGGIPLEYYNRMVSIGAAQGRKDCPVNAWPKDLELSKIVIDQMVDEAGVDTWFMTQFIDVVMDEDRVLGALVNHGGVMTLIEAPVIVDTSGDGLVAVAAGADYEVGRDEDHRAEATTLYFEIAGVDVQTLLDYLEENPGDISPHHRAKGIDAAELRGNIEKGLPFVVRLGLKYDEALEAGSLPQPVVFDRSKSPVPSRGTFWMHWRDGRWIDSSFSVNIDTTYGLNSLNREDMDRALIETRRFVYEMVRHYQKNVPGFENAYLLRFAPILGVREGPRIQGLYRLTAKDIVGVTDFEDAIGRCGVRIDIHPEDEEGKEFVLSDVGGDRGWYQIPLRSLIVAGIEGVLMAGRCISADHLVHGSLRHQVTCMMTGHAAGVAAALASKKGVAPSQVSAEDVQEVLVAQGAII